MHTLLEGIQNEAQIETAFGHSCKYPLLEQWGHFLFLNFQALIAIHQSIEKFCDDFTFEKEIQKMSNL